MASQLDSRIELMRCLDEVEALGCIEIEVCVRLRRKLADEAFHLVVVGEFKRGKRSIINALLGEALLPTGVVPLT